MAFDCDVAIIKAIFRLSSLVFIRPRLTNVNVLLKPVDVEKRDEDDSDVCLMLFLCFHGNFALSFDIHFAQTVSGALDLMARRSVEHQT